VNIGDILKDAVGVFGFKDAASAPQQALDRALNDINGAIQQITNAGEDFFGREEMTVTLIADTESYVLAKNVQTVLKPARLSDGTVLRELTARGQLLQFGQVFQGQLGGTVAAGKPIAYFVESLRDTADTTGDNVAITVRVLPKPATSWAAAVTLLLNVIRQPALFTAGQLSTGTALLEIPHKYVESIFLPLMRYNLSGSYLFQDKNKKAQIDADYERALALLGKSDPRRDKPTGSNTDAMRSQRAEAGGQRAAA
jgi:hypothetical protein